MIFFPLPCGQTALYGYSRKVDQREKGVSVVQGSSGPGRLGWGRGRAAKKRPARKRPQLYSILSMYL